jgi:CheY-like chemotaxis protein
MPKMDGVESTAKIRELLTLKLKVPIDLQPNIIGLTGHVADDFTKAGLEAGMNAIYSKPLYFGVLEEILDKYYY